MRLICIIKNHTDDELYRIYNIIHKYINRYTTPKCRKQMVLGLQHSQNIDFSALEVSGLAWSCHVWVHVGPMCNSASNPPSTLVAGSPKGGGNARSHFLSW